MKHKDVVKQVLCNAVEKMRNCVLREENIVEEIYRLMRDDDDA